MNSGILQLHLPLNILQFNLQSSRCISTSIPVYGKRNFRKFTFPNKSSAQSDKDRLRKNPELVDRRGVRPYGFWKDAKFTPVPEMIPELVVPDLKDFHNLFYKIPSLDLTASLQLKPYVSYKTADISQEKFTAEHLFYCAYFPKMKTDFEAGKLDEEGNPLEPSESEKLTADEAKSKARQSGNDLFG